MEKRISSHTLLRAIELGDKLIPFGGSNGPRCSSIAGDGGLQAQIREPHVGDLLLSLLDTIGTVVATALFGLLPGLATAIGSNIFMELINGISGNYLPWMSCNISSAVILWILTRRNQFETLMHARLAGPRNRGAV